MTMLSLITIAIALSQLADWYSTRKILGAGGYEQNPVAKKGMDLLGVNGYLAAKVVFATGLGYFAGTQNIWLAVLVLCAYVVAMWHNWKSLKK